MEAPEPSRWCRICGKALTNPVSVQLGMGPVCYPRGCGTSRARRRTRHQKQERAMRRDEQGRWRSTYTWSIDGQVIVIVDLDQGRSVTNDADLVIQDLAAAGIPVDRYGILYLDTTKRYDGLATRDGRFAGFIPLGKSGYAEARELLLQVRTTGQGAAKGVGGILPTLAGDTAAALGGAYRDVLNPRAPRKTSTGAHDLTPGEQEGCGHAQGETPPTRVH